MTIRDAIIFLSTILLIGTTVLWVRSPRMSYVFAFRSPRGYLNGVASDRGGVLFVTTDFYVDGEYGTPDSQGRQSIRYSSFLSVPADVFAMLHNDLFSAPATTWGIAGCRAASGSALGPLASPFHALLVPYWYLLVISAPLPLAASRRFLQKQRWRRLGRCLNCGYDMRASAGLCPECGSEVRRSRPSTPSAAQPSSPAID